MPDINYYDEKIKRFNTHMLQKLLDNDYKGTWEKSTYNYLINRLIDEVEELIELIDKKERIVKITNECADIANFAMMISDNYTINTLEEKANQIIKNEEKRIEERSKYYER
jgi:NTP pyrophosphatase (non-canonical NTP hydrolase)